MSDLTRRELFRGTLAGFGVLAMAKFVPAKAVGPVLHPAIVIGSWVVELIVHDRQGRVLYHAEHATMGTTTKAIEQELDQIIDTHVSSKGPLRSRGYDFLARVKQALPV